jgi:DNA adenine methylase
VGFNRGKFPSPLRYPGGKGKVTNFIKLLLLENDLVGAEYVEPYAGGASVALSLLYEEYVSHIHINDLNRSVHAFWRAVLTTPTELCDLIETASITTQEWDRQRAVQQLTDPDPLALAFSTFYLNRTSRSGIIGGGMIGGREQTGDWKLGARFNRDELIERIRKIARFKNRITLTGIDTAEYLATTLTDVERPFLFLDPPYYVKGEGLYQNYYRHQDHQTIAKLVMALDAPWVVSYDAAPEITTMYQGVASVHYDLNYSAANRYRGSEVMFFSPNLSLPDVVSPALIATKETEQARRASLDLVAAGALSGPSTPGNYPSE